MKKLMKLNVGNIVALLILSCIAYYVLLQDNFLHLSIASIISHSHDLELKKHLIVLGLLPIYIAAIIFGSCLLALYVGSTLQHMVIRTRRHR